MSAKRVRPASEASLRSDHIEAAVLSSDDSLKIDAGSAAPSSGECLAAGPLPLVSVIIPVHNTKDYLEECIRSVLAQSYRGPMELSVYDDASDDDTRALLHCLQSECRSAGRPCMVSGPGWVDSVPLDRLPPGACPSGSGFGRNQAVAKSGGEFLCLLDSDDVMEPHRVESQLATGRSHPWALIGCQFRRVPEDSTSFYTRWANSLSPAELVLQQFREITIIQPTWFMHRQVFDRVGGWPDNRGSSHHVPEDLYFFHEHLARGGELVRVDEILLVYRRTLLRHKLALLERRVLDGWESFMIWGAGRDGKNVFSELSDSNRRKVAAFVDIAPGKMGHYHHATLRVSVPVRPIEEVKPPFIVCVAMGRTDGALEANVAKMGWVEGKDYWHFS